MERLKKKCFVASISMHVFLLLLLVMGSAFFISDKKPAPPLPSIRVVPTRFVDDLLAGGGGNPKIAPSLDRPKGDTLMAPPKPPEPAPPKPVEPAPVKPVVKAPPPKVEQTVSKPPKVDQVTVKKNGREPVVKPTSTPAKDDNIMAMLKPVKRSAQDKQRLQQEAEAAQAAAEAKQAAARQQAIAKLVGRSADGLRAGFKDGTKIEVGGPGGEATANYAAFVREAFDSQWDVPPSLTAEDGVAVAEVIIARDGTIIRKHIIERSNVPILDRSVQRALDRVVSLPPFPSGAKEERRTYILEFNLRTKRNIG